MSALVNAKLYTPLQKWQTRVLRLHPAQHGNELLKADLLRAGLADGPYLMLSMDEPLIQFEAISYTWGEPGQFHHNIICNGLSVPILPSLDAALRRFRRTDSARYLWADALCINQADDAEKSFQVVNMFSIFHKARRVLAWLGKEGSFTGQALAHLRAAGLDDDRASDLEREFRVENVLKASKPQLVHALEDLMRLPWCRRVWVQQEVWAARELTLFCGEQRLGLEEYQSIAKSIRQVLWSNRRNIDPDSPITDSELENSRMLEAISGLRMAPERELAQLQPQSSNYTTKDPWTTFQHTRASNESLEQTLLRGSTLEASDPRDHVFALLKLTDCPTIHKTTKLCGKEDGMDPQLGITVDYSRSLSEVLQDVTRFIMNTDQSIAVLDAYEPRESGPHINEGLPSWTIDWRTQSPNWTRQDITVKQMPGDYLDYREHPWGFQLPNPSGTLRLGGTKLASVSSFHVHAYPTVDVITPTTERLVDVIDFETQSHILARATNGTLIALDWTNVPRKIRCRSSTRDDRNRQQYSDAELKKLQRVQPDDILVHIDGMRGRLVYLRPTSNDKFTFVCMIDVHMQLELLVTRAYIPGEGLRGHEFFHQYSGRPLEILKQQIGEEMQDFLIAAQAPHREFTIR